MESMDQNGYAFFSGKVGYYPVSKLSAIIIKTEQDLKLAEYVVKAMKEKEPLKYDVLTKSLSD